MQSGIIGCTVIYNKTKGEKMKKLLLLTMLSIGFLTACSSPKVSNIQSKYVENNPINYKTVKTAEINVETRKQLNGDTLTQDFGEVNISYYDDDGNSITTESYNTIQDALDNNKTGMTRVQNDGRGTLVTYTAHLKDSTEERTYNVPYIAEVNTKSETEAEMERQMEKTKTKDQFEWTGEANHTISNIKVTQKDYYTTSEYRNVWDSSKSKYVYKLKEVDMVSIHELTYRYDNNQLTLINENTYTQER